ncbi:hypothetical protein HYY75_09015, partial [bacterium]|nr:hypothetical protein [bacterium]
SVSRTPELRTVDGEILRETLFKIEPSNVIGTPGASQEPSYGGPSTTSRVYQIQELVSQPGPGPVSDLLESVKSLNSPKILTQLKNTFILGEDVDGLFIIDQHVAHERVLFDTYVESYRNVPMNAQPLLFPIPIQLLPSERITMKERGNELKELGFLIHEEDDGMFYATSIPFLGALTAKGNKTISDQEAIQALISQILGGWEGRSVVELKLDLLKTMACKTAIKAGDPLKDTEMRSLFEQLIKTQNPFTCPHGRPIILRLSIKKIEKGFLRS